MAAWYSASSVFLTVRTIVLGSRSTRPILISLILGSGFAEGFIGHQLMIEGTSSAPLARCAGHLVSAHKDMGEKGGPDLKGTQCLAVKD
jgi:hypothetical protein